MTYKPCSNCRKFSLFAALLLLLQSAYAQYDFKQAEQWMKQELGSLGGRAVLVIYKDGKIVYSHAENDMNRRQQMMGKWMARKQGKSADDALQDFTENTKERIASSSKWLSAALVMSFVDEGKLSLDDTVGKFLPVMTANGKGGISIWQCLSHLTGIQTGTLKESIEAMKNISSMDEAMEQLAKLPMEGRPGKVFHYSNAGLQIAAAVIEKISGKDFETLFAERIARPCGMQHTDFGHAKPALPAGGAWSTADDYIKFLSMILNEGQINGRQVLSKKAITEMQQNRIAKDATIGYSPAEAGNWGYGFGEWIMDGSSVNQRSNAVSSPGLFGSFPWINLSQQYAGFLLTFNLQSKGRNDRYTSLKKICDAALNAGSK